MRAAGAIVAADGGGGGGGGLPVTGGTMQGDIDMAGFSIINESLVTVETAVSATTASLGFADRYVCTAPSITLTISSADIVDGRRFVIVARNAGVSASEPVTIATEGAETIDSQGTVALVADHYSVTLVANGGNLGSES